MNPFRGLEKVRIPLTQNRAAFYSRDLPVPNQSTTCSVPNIWRRSGKWKQLRRYVRSWSPHECFQVLASGLPICRVLPFQSVLVQTFMNCWATIGSQPVSRTAIGLHWRTCEALLPCLSVFQTAALVIPSPSSKPIRGSPFCLLNRPGLPCLALTAWAAPRTAPRTPPPPPPLGPFAQQAGQAFPCAGAPRTCLHLFFMAFLLSGHGSTPQVSLIPPSSWPLPCSRLNQMVSSLESSQSLGNVSWWSAPSPSCPGYSHNCLLTLEDCELIVCRTWHIT